MTPTTTNNAIIIERLEALACDMLEIKASLKEYQQSSVKFLVDFEIRYAAVDNKAGAAHTRLDKHDAEITAMTKSQAETARMVTSLVLQSKVINFVGAGLGVSIIALIWGILTHQVTLTF
jgi:hypothetical protein